MYKIIVSILLIFSGFQNIVGAEVKCNEKGNLYINQKIINNGDDVVFENEALFPLRTIFENLGAIVDWEENTQSVSIDYNHNKYLCELKAPNPDFPDVKYIYVKDISNNEYFLLTPMSTGGMYRIINDSIYLYEDTGKRLFEAMGCQVDIRMNEIYISNMGV